MAEADVANNLSVVLSSSPSKRGERKLKENDLIIVIHGTPE